VISLGCRERKISGERPKLCCLLQRLVLKWVRIVDLQAVGAVLANPARGWI